MTKAQGRRSNRKAGHYKDQFIKTARNKARRAAKRERLANSIKAEGRKVLRLAKAEAKRIANLSRSGGILPEKKDM